MSSGDRPSDPTLRLVGLPLGRFVLESRLGIGGMSEVWAGVDPETGTDVAVKLLFESPTRRDEARRRARIDALFKELHALARLDHEGILPLLDFGTIDVATEAATHGALLAGSPYLVTPRVAGGSLETAPEPASYEALVSILVSLAGALAHAHARGVVHRDLKPGNVLLDLAPGASEPRPLLSDFGISYARELGLDVPLRAGTPSTMAPEQIRGARDQGPPTDLYALGCLAYRLATGVPPFSGTTDDVLRAHLLAPPPRLVPLMPVPRAFEDWLGVLLEKRPTARFASARAAAHALLTLPSTPMLPARVKEVIADAAVGTDAARRRREEPTAPARMVTLTTAISSRIPEAIENEVLEPVASRAARSSHFPPAPTDVDWRVLEENRSRFGVTTGSGFALFGLRTVPLVGRDDLRDRLHVALASVARERRPRVVLVTGPLGIGATRLGEWMLEASAELDLAVTARTSCTAAAPRGESLVVLLERLVRARGLTELERREQIHAWLDDVSRHAPDPRDEADLVALFSRDPHRLRERAPRHAAIRRLLARAASRRPLVLLFDDAVLDGDVVAFLDALARTTEGLPVLALVTSTDETLAAHVGEADVLRRIAEGPRGEHVGLGPLARADIEALATRAFGLDPALAHEIAERSQGHPLYAIQLVSDWVSKGSLVRGIDGLRMREGASADVPDGIHTIFLGRLEGLGSTLATLTSPEEAERALVGLEIAAVLGMSPEPDVWLAACEARGAWANEAVLRLPEARGLFRWRTGRFELAHPLLRESLERRARERGRLAGHHAAIADILEETRGDTRRIASHRLAAGQVEAALAPLLASVESRIDRSDLLGAHEALDRYAEALEMLGAAPDDPRYLPKHLRRAEAFAQVAFLDRAEAALDAATAVAVSAIDRAAVAQLRGAVAARRGATALAVTEFDEALRLVPDRTLAPRVVDGARFGIAEVLKLTGDFPRAEAAYREVLAHTSPDDRMHAMALVGLSDAASRAGRPEEALRYGEEALRRLEQKSYWHAVGVTQNSLGDLERRRGQLAEAERHYREALEIMLVIGSADAAIVRMNLALLELRRDDLAAAEVMLVAARTALEGRDRELYVKMADAMRLPSAIGRRDREGCAPLLAAARSVCETIADPDVGDVLGLAARLAKDAGWDELAETLAGLAETQTP